MKFIKKMFIALVMGLAVQTQLKADNDKVITFTELPRKAQLFVKSYFPSHKVSVVKLDRELFGRNYEILFTDGSKIEFDKKGQWKDVDCRHGNFPIQLVPASIRAHIDQNYKGHHVIQIEKSDRGNYVVELHNGVELVFNKKYQFVGIDD